MSLKTESDLALAADELFNCSWDSPSSVSTPAPSKKSNTKKRKRKEDDINCDMGKKKSTNNMRNKFLGEENQMTKKKSKLTYSDGVTNEPNIGKGLELSTGRSPLISTNSTLPTPSSTTPTATAISTSSQKSCKHSSKDHLLLSTWKLPLEVLSRYTEAGVERLFEWQMECLCTGKVLGRCGTK